MRKKLLLLVPMILLAACKKESTDPGKLVVNGHDGSDVTTVEVTTSGSNVEVVKDSKSSNASNSSSSSNGSSSSNSNLTVKEQADATLAKFDKSKFHEGLTDSQIKELSNARGSEEKLREKSNYVMQTHPQNDKDDKEYTYASFISSNIQSKTESNDSSIKKMIITKLRATEDKTKAFVNDRSTAYDIASVAENEFYNDYTGVTSWMIYLSNGWTIAESSIRIYDYDNNGTFQYTVEWTKNGQVMGYMMGTYYKQLNQTALKSFTMTQKGSLDNYKTSLERGKVR